MMTVTELAQIPRIPPELMQLGADPKLLAEELRYFILLYGRNRPRSLQRRIGPSQVGTPCVRKLAYMIGEDTPSHGIAHAQSDSWRTAVGTAVHAYLADVFAGLNSDTHERDGFSRFLVESAVNVGEINGREVIGHADLYDRVTATVVDWKIVGPTTIRTTKANGPKTGYRVQAHLYGRGFTRRGLPVENVGIMYLPSAGEIRDAFYWSEPYDESIAVNALTRASVVSHAMSVATGGLATVLPALPTEDDYCSTCPWFRPGARQASPDGCPGHHAAPAPLPSASEVLGAA